MCVDTLLLKIPQLLFEPPQHSLGRLGNLTAARSTSLSTYRTAGRQQAPAADSYYSWSAALQSDKECRMSFTLG